MKLETFPAVAHAWSSTHFSHMRKIYHSAGVNDLWAQVGCKGGHFTVMFTPKTTSRVLASGAHTLTIFGTMRDLVPQIEESMSMRAIWGGVGEHIRRAAEQETRAATSSGSTRVKPHAVATTRRSLQRHVA